MRLGIDRLTILKSVVLLLVILVIALFIGSSFTSTTYTILKRKAFNNMVIEQLKSINITVVEGYTKPIFYATTQNISDIIEISKIDPFENTAIVQNGSGDYIKIFTLFDGDSEMAYQISTPNFSQWYWLWEVNNREGSN